MVRLVRRRYVAFKLDVPPFPSKKELLTVISEKVAVANDNGREGLEQQRIRVIEYDPDTGSGIVRCDHRTVSALRSSTKSSEEQCLKTIKTSGSIKALRRRLLSKQSNSYEKTQSSY